MLVTTAKRIINLPHRVDCDGILYVLEDADESSPLFFLILHRNCNGE